MLQNEVKPVQPGTMKGLMANGNVDRVIVHRRSVGETSLRGEVITSEFAILRRVKTHVR